MPTSQITLEHPAGRVRVQVSTDERLEELLPDFLDVTAQPDRDDWALGPAQGILFPADRTLAELGLGDGAVLVLHTGAGELGAARDADAWPCPVNGAAPAELTAPTTRPDDEEVLRPVSARTERILPQRLSRPQRLATAYRAFSDRTRLRLEGPTTSRHGVPDPALFALPARISPWSRMQRAWVLSQYDRLLEQQVLALHLRRCVTIAVVSPKGGVGKTTTTALLGSLLAHLRRDRVVAVDTNPDYGSLGRRLVPNHPVFIDDLLAGPLKDGALTPTQLDAQLGRGPDGLMIAPAPTDRERARNLDENAYRTLFERLSDLVGTLVLDCGTGLDQPAAIAAMACADQLVLVADGEPDTASLVAEAAQDLERHAPPLVLVANNLNRRSLVDVDALEREVCFARGLVRVPTNKPGAQQLHASRFSWTQPPAGWAVPIRELAAVLAADWPRLDIAH